MHFSFQHEDYRSPSSLLHPGSLSNYSLTGHSIDVLLGSRQAAGPFLECLGVLLRPGGLIVGTGSDPYQTSDRVHLESHERNRRRDCIAGQNMMRVRYERKVRLARPSRAEGGRLLM